MLAKSSCSLENWGSVERAQGARPRGVWVKVTKVVPHCPWTASLQVRGSVQVWVTGYLLPVHSLPGCYEPTGCPSQDNLGVKGNIGQVAVIFVNLRFPWRTILFSGMCFLECFCCCCLFVFLFCFIWWAKLRMSAQDTASQVALRDSSFLSSFEGTTVMCWADVSIHGPDPREGRLGCGKYPQHPSASCWSPGTRWVYFCRSQHFIIWALVCVIQNSALHPNDTLACWCLACLSCGPCHWMRLSGRKPAETLSSPPHLHSRAAPSLPPAAVFGLHISPLNITALGFASLKVHLSEEKPTHTEG